MPIPLGILAVAGAGAAGGASSFDLLETTVLSSSAASVTFSNLGNYSAYKHLEIRYVVRSDRAATIDNIQFRVNGDTGNNYMAHDLYGQGTSVVSTNGVGTGNNYIYGPIIAASTGAANNFGVGVISILDFGNTSKNKTLRILGGNAGGTGERYIQLTSGLWISTSAITSFNLFPRNGTNLLANSRFSLYGIK